jgi:MFS family permease
MIAIGLVFFLLGSVVGMFANTLGWVIAARALQGAGSMSAAVTALLADHTRDEVRTRAMAFIGISIGASFVISLITAPLLEAMVGVPGIFWVMALMAVLGLLLLKFAVPAHGEQAPDPAATRIPTLRVAAQSARLLCRGICPALHSHCHLSGGATAAAKGTGVCGSGALEDLSGCISGLVHGHGAADTGCRTHRAATPYHGVGGAGGGAGAGRHGAVFHP